MNKDKYISSLSQLSQSDVTQAYQKCRQRTLDLVESLSAEEMNLQTDVFTSPPKWHLAHTTWFFETFILKEFLSDYLFFNDKFEFLFNSYYNSIGKPYPRSQRGFLTRPSFQEILEYRHQIDCSILKLIESRFNESPRDWLHLVELGMHHEYQHQELILTDIKYSLFQNPTFPQFKTLAKSITNSVMDLIFVDFDECIVDIGASSTDGFCYDNESPPHKHLQLPFSIANRHTTNAEYLKFIEDGGYENPEYWIADGWETLKRENWKAPLYWKRNNQKKWQHFTLGGLLELDLNEPVCHVSYFEADAFARWSGVCLPTEQMLEIVARKTKVEGQFFSDQSLHPIAANDGKSDEVFDLYGKVWEWTKSPYSAYHGFKIAEGAVGEYNGKFMCNQFVLRGGSCLTHRAQMRPTYRNFFYPHERWQMTGIRLAKEH